MSCHNKEIFCIPSKRIEYTVMVHRHEIRHLKVNIVSQDKVKVKSYCIAAVQNTKYNRILT